MKLFHSEQFIHIAEGLAIAYVTLEMTLQRIKERKSKQRNYLNRATKDARSYSMLHELRRDVGADRILLMRFHNGGKYADGASINKISITQDAHPLHKSSVSFLMQSIAFDKLPHLIVAMTTSKSVHYKRAAKDAFLNEFFLQAHIEQLYALPLRKKGQVIGLVAAVTDNEKKEISESDKERINQVALQLQALI